MDKKVKKPKNEAKSNFCSSFRETMKRGTSDRDWEREQWKGNGSNLCLQTTGGGKPRIRIKELMDRRPGLFKQKEVLMEMNWLKSGYSDQ